MFQIALSAGSLVITIGSSNANIKTVNVSAPVACPSVVSKANWVGGPLYATDTFEITQSGTSLSAKRTDNREGWGMDLRITCAMDTCPRPRTLKELVLDSRGPGSRTLESLTQPLKEEFDELLRRSQNNLDINKDGAISKIEWATIKWSRSGPLPDPNPIPGAILEYSQRQNDYYNPIHCKSTSVVEQWQIRNCCGENIGTMEWPFIGPPEAPRINRSDGLSYPSGRYHHRYGYHIASCGARPTIVWQVSEQQWGPIRCQCMKYDEDMLFIQDSSWKPKFCDPTVQKLKVKAALLFKSMQPFVELQFPRCPYDYCVCISVAIAIPLGCLARNLHIGTHKCTKLQPCQRSKM